MPKPLLFLLKSSFPGSVEQISLRGRLNFSVGGYFGHSSRISIHNDRKAWTLSAGAEMIFAQRGGPPSSLGKQMIGMATKRQKPEQVVAKLRSFQVYFVHGLARPISFYQETTENCGMPGGNPRWSILLHDEIEGQGVSQLRSDQQP